MKFSLILIFFVTFYCSVSSAAPTLVVDGVDESLANEIRNSIVLTFYSCDIEAWRKPHLETQFSEKAQKTLRALGYYHPKITARIVKENAAAQCWKLKLDVTPATRVVVDQLNIDINPEFSNNLEFKALLENLPLTEGSYLEHGKYELIKQRITEIAIRYGYFNSYFSTRELSVDSEANTATITIGFNSGDRFKFGKITIDKVNLSDQLLNQYLVIKEGFPYHSDLLTEQQIALNNSQYFNSVSVNTERENSKNKTIPVTIKLSLKKRKAYRVGLGASTDIGPRLSLRFENRRANNNGNRLKFNTSFSQVRNEFNTSYSIPRGDAGNNRLDYSAGLLTEKTDTSDKKSIKMAIQSTRLSSSDWLHTRFIEYLGEDFITADDEHKVSLVMPGYQLQKTVADNLIFPKKGWRLRARIQLANENLLSDISLLQVTSGLKIVYPFIKGRLLLRSDLGATETNDFSRTPASLRFYAGGDGSLRGFAYQQLGPSNSTDEVIGGEFLTTSTVELEYPVYGENWGLAVFTDFGNAFDDINDFEFKSSVGFGLRWHSPLGPIRFDLAQDLERDESIRFHLSMGPDL